MENLGIAGAIVVLSGGIALAGGLANGNYGPINSAEGYGGGLIGFGILIIIVAGFVSLRNLRR